MIFDESLENFENSDAYGKLIESEYGQQIVSKFVNLRKMLEKVSIEDRKVFEENFSRQFMNQLNQLRDSFANESDEAAVATDQHEINFTSSIPMIIIIFLGMSLHIFFGK
jgi:hypothetical protein